MEKQRKRRLARLGGALVVIVVVGLAGACSRGEQTSAAASVRPAAATVAVPATPDPATATPTREASRKPATRKAPAMVRVPDGVGRDYQSAQDIWRAAGLIVAPAKDDTGAHRLPVIDANWVVLAQDRKAGSRVRKGSLITATVKKYSDD
ncbi:hypothetical protein ACWT_4740 [Actinoplanes sp. SE50]|uniref:PASTA domain-containing protein n=1 Tax=unclassified Actinoplanes TaxID=2626549 RepID=UPI00023EBF65|nr:MULTISPECIES: PASTA domain-containing protein [unclassified Actinoplanes]AEV85762.1 hypothetical protein ACPL_4871 [Actinoplanes sp. SE50/110]ATO84155.1 hypothetical protein ACWT_4740 [Actinoplanes sp. SE50]SLM01565.1 hypothetical protein ACSP50_4801 [Actinoplanes sp. SE50/110]